MFAMLSRSCGDPVRNEGLWLKLLPLSMFLSAMGLLQREPSCAPKDGDLGAWVGTGTGKCWGLGDTVNIICGGTSPDRRPSAAARTPDSRARQ